MHSPPRQRQRRETKRTYPRWMHSLQVRNDIHSTRYCGPNRCILAVNPQFFIAKDSASIFTYPTVSNMSVPFAEPPWANGLPSYWFTPELAQFQKACRAFITEHLTQHAWEWDKEETVPAHVFTTFAKHNMLVPALVGHCRYELIVLKLQG